MAFEGYFEGVNIVDKPSKVWSASLYLFNHVTLWWHRKHLCVYVQDYTNLLLHVSNMAEEDLLFHFIDGLQN